MGKLNLLLTGGSGFIGRNIRESFLSEKYNILSPSRAELDYGNDDNVRDYFEHHSFDVVIHTAGKPGHRRAQDATNILQANSRMFFNLVNCQFAWKKLIIIGSGAVYGMDYYLPKMPETYFGTHIPKDDHGFSKYIIGKLLPSLENVYDLRVFGIYGKYEDYSIRFISNAICKTLFDLPITLKQDRFFDYIYIDDLMPILDHFIQHSPKEKAFNITPDKSTGLLEIAGIVNQLAGNGNEIKVTTEGRALEYSGNNELLKKEIPHLTFTHLEEGVSKLREWYLENLGNIDGQKLLVDK